MCGPLLPIDLRASALFDRHGFGDGRPFEFADRGPEHDDDPPHADYVRLYEDQDNRGRHELLERLVRRHLLPVITERTGETPTLVRIGTHHNQIRDSRFGPPQGIARMPEQWSDIVVEVSPEEILAELDEMEARSAA